jgi:anti-anti-sigma factor
MSTEVFDLTVEHCGGATVARLRGEVDTAAAPQLHEQLLAATGDDPLILDLTAVEYLDSAGIAVLDALRRVRDFRLVLDEQSIVARAIGIVGFDQLIPVSGSTDDALAALAATPD